MGIVHVGIRELRSGNSEIKRAAGIHDYTLQLFWTATVFWIDGKQTIASPNTMIIFKKGDPQHFYSAEQMMCNAYVIFSLEPGMTAELTFNKPITVEDPEPFHRLMTAIFEEKRSEGANKEQTMHYLLMALLSKVMEAYTAFDEKRATDHGASKLQRLRDEVFSDPQRQWHVTDMAGNCGLSPSRFQTVYKKTFSVSPMQDVINARIILAKKYLLESEDSLRSVAQYCGYQDESHFIRQFKKLTGLTPTEFRSKKW